MGVIMPHPDFFQWRKNYAKPMSKCSHGVWWSTDCSKCELEYVRNELGFEEE